MSTSTEVATQNTAPVPTGGGALALSPGQTNWTPEQLAVVKQLGLEGATEGELSLFLHVCQQTGLDPFAKQIYGIMRNQYNQNTRRSEPKLTIQTGIDGFRLVASRANRRTGEPSTYEGRVGPLWCGRDGVWTDVWTGDIHPYAAKVGVYKRGFREPLWATCHYSEYVQTKQDGSPVPMWANMPANQLAKCAEAAALRGAFPQDLSSVYAPEEMGHVAAQSLADRTVEASPMRSDEEQEQWDAVVAAERALDADKLGKLYTAAAHAKNDLLVASIRAAGFRVREALAKKAAASQAADEQAADEAPVDAEVVPEPPAQEPPPAAEPEQDRPVAGAPDALITKAGVQSLKILFGNAGFSTLESQLEVIKNNLSVDIQSLDQLTAPQSDNLVKVLNILNAKRKAQAQDAGPGDAG